MIQRCKNCGEKIIKFPIWKGQDRGVPFSFDKIKWLNLFKMDMYSIILVIVVTVMVIGYKADIAKCDEVIEHPCEFCETSMCCQVDWSYIRGNDLMDKQGVKMLDIPDFDNIT